MKQIFLLTMIIVALILSGCDKDEIPVPESEDVVLKAAATDKITITKTLPNGKVIEIQVPADAAETIIASSEKLPYSPEGTYLFMYKDEPNYTYDVFISSFDGDNFTGTYGHPSGGTYEYTGAISGTKGELDSWGFQRFSGNFFIGDKRAPMEIATSEADGIIKNSRIPKPNMFLVLSTVPYSPEGWYKIGEFLDEQSQTPYLDYTVLITSFDGNNFKGKYVTKFFKSEDYFYGELQGTIGDTKDETAPFTMNLLLENDGVVSVYKTIAGTVHKSDGINVLDFPFKIIPVRVVD